VLCENGRIDRRRLRYVPALDGLRAAAVLGVIGYHDAIPWLRGGFLGVDAFFVLSGFLITSLLVEERLATGGLALGDFWARRARRLLPALFLMLAFVLAEARWIVPTGTWPNVRLDALSTLFYVANWHFILQGQNYFVLTGVPSPLLHTWSLAIEEQFYLLWPLAVLGIFALARRSQLQPEGALRLLAWVSVLGAVASAAEMALLAHPGQDATREYFGTDTHAVSLLVGCALAAFLRLRRATSSTRGRGRAVGWVAGLLGAGLGAWTWSSIGENAIFVERGGIVLGDLAAALVIAGVVLAPEGPMPRLLSLGPVRYVGRISYGMYLWHWPLQFAIDHATTGLEGWPLFGARLAATLVAAAGSYHLVERPVREGRVIRAGRAWLVGPAATLGLAGAIVAATTTPAAGLDRVAAIHDAPAPAAAERSEPVRVLLVGDSVALTLGMGLDAVASHYGVQLFDEGQLGCGVAIGSEYRSHGSVNPVGWYCNTHPAPGYVQWPLAWAQWVREYRPQVVVLLAGRWEVMDRTWHGRWTNLLHPAYAAYIERQLQLAIRVATAGGARMVLLTAPCFSSGEQPDGQPWPEDSLVRVERYNALVDEAAATSGGRVVVENLFSMVCPGGHFESVIDGVQVRQPDGVHFTVAGGELLAPRLLPRWVVLAR
jgi:peptidoglycan/LPS O-acetylase OafA/YrhL